MVMEANGREIRCPSEKSPPYFASQDEKTLAVEG